VNKPDPKLRVELTAVLPLSWWRSLGRVILNVRQRLCGSQPEFATFRTLISHFYEERHRDI
jgi:hypothetical protein